MNLVSVESSDYSTAVLYTYDCGLMVKIVSMSDGSIRIRPMSPSGDYSYICSMYKDNREGPWSVLVDKTNHAMAHYFETHGYPKQIGVALMSGTDFDKIIVDAWKKFGYTWDNKAEEPCEDCKKSTRFMFFTKGVDQASIAQ